MGTHVEAGVTPLSVWSHIITTLSVVLARTESRRLLNCVNV